MLKKKASEAPVLALPNLKRTFEVETNTSSYAIRSILVQDGSPIEYHLELFFRAIMNYPPYDKEFCALYQAVKYSRLYLLSKEVVLHFNHMALEYLHV